MIVIDRGAEGRNAGEAAEEEEEDRGCFSGGDKNWPKFGRAIYLPIFATLWIYKKNILFRHIHGEEKVCGEIARNSTRNGESHSMNSWTPESAPPSSVSGEGGEEKKRTVGHTHLEKQDIATDKVASSSFFCSRHIPWECRYGDK